MNSPPDDQFFFFVYGLLMSGGPGFHALRLAGRVDCLGPERISGRLYHLGDYPGLVTGGLGVVHGELLAFRDATLAEELDAYELYDPENPAGSEYRRIEVELLASGRCAWTYEYNRAVDNRPVIATGSWRAR